MYWNIFSYRQFIQYFSVISLSQVCSESSHWSTYFQCFHNISQGDAGEGQIYLLTAACNWGQTLKLLFTPTSLSWGLNLNCLWFASISWFIYKILVWMWFSCIKHTIICKPFHLYFTFCDQVEDSQGNVGPGEREYLISPNYSSVVMSAIHTAASPDPHIMQSKKPFDWMTDDQFHNLQVNNQWLSMLSNNENVIFQTGY